MSLKRRQVAAYLFLAPALSFFVIFTFVPVVMAFVIAFHRLTLSGWQFVGFENFKTIFSAEDFWIAFRNTVLYTSVFVVKNVFLALTIASLISPLSNRVQTFFRAAYYLPTVIASVVFAIIWSWMFNYSFGPVNNILMRLGLEPVPWLNDPSLALWTVILTDVLIAPGSGIILYLAAINNIPQTLYEAADLDGATPIMKWLKITVPLIMPTTLYLTVIYTVAGLSIFDKVFVLTGGGPGKATITLVYLIYTSAFRDFDYGRSAAVSLIFFGVSVIISIFQFRAMAKSYELEG